MSSGEKLGEGLGVMGSGEGSTVGVVSMITGAL